MIKELFEANSPLSYEETGVVKLTSREAEQMFIRYALPMLKQSGYQVNKVGKYSYYAVNDKYELFIDSAAYNPYTEEAPAVIKEIGSNKVHKAGKNGLLKLVNSVLKGTIALDTVVSSAVIGFDFSKWYANYSNQSATSKLFGLGKADVAPVSDLAKLGKMLDKYFTDVYNRFIN